MAGICRELLLITNRWITQVDRITNRLVEHTHTLTARGWHRAAALGLGDGRQVFESLPWRTDRWHLLSGQRLKGLGDQMRLSGDHLSPAGRFDYFGRVSVR